MAGCPNVRVPPSPVQGVLLPQNTAESTSITREAFGVDDDPLHGVILAGLRVTIRLQVHVDLQGTVCQRTTPWPVGTGSECLCLLPVTHHPPTLTSSMMDSGHQVACKPHLTVPQQQVKSLAAAGPAGGWDAHPATRPCPALACPPAPEFEGAVLPVEGEEVDIDGTGAAEDGGWQPVDGARVVDEDVAVVGDLEEPIVAAPGENQGDGRAGAGQGKPRACTGYSSGDIGGETESRLTCSPGLSQAATACPAAGGAPRCPQTQTCSTAGGNQSSPGRGNP